MTCELSTRHWSVLFMTWTVSGFMRPHWGIFTNPWTAFLNVGYIHMSVNKF